MRKLACLLFVFMLLPLICFGESVADRYGLESPVRPREQSSTVATYQGVTLRVSCDETTVFPGETVGFIVSVENSSAGSMESIMLSERSIGSGKWGKTASQLPAGEQMKVAYTVRIPDTLHDIALFQLQWHGGSMMVQHELNVVEPANLTVQAEVQEWPWQAGEEHTADFIVTNQGGTVLENVTLTLPGVYLDGQRIGDAIFLRKDRRKLKTTQQTDSLSLGELVPGDSVTMTVAWTPDTLPEGMVALTMQAAVESDGRMQTRAATALMERVVVHPTVWTTMVKGDVSMGHVLCGLAGLTLMVALAALLRARKLR